MTLSFITNNPVKIAICHLLEFTKGLRSKSVTLQVCNSRGLDSAMHTPVFPCFLHLTLPFFHWKPSVWLQKMIHMLSPRPGLGHVPPSHADAHLHWSIADLCCSFPLKGSASWKKWAKSLRIAVPSVSKLSVQLPPAHGAGKAWSPLQQCVWFWCL